MVLCERNTVNLISGDAGTLLGWWRRVPFEFPIGTERRRLLDPWRVEKGWRVHALTIYTRPQWRNLFSFFFFFTPASLLDTAVPYYNILSSIYTLLLLLCSRPRDLSSLSLIPRNRSRASRNVFLYLDCFMSVGILDLHGPSVFCCCFCFCLYLDRAKNRPSMAFKLPSLTSWAVMPSRPTPSVSRRSRQLLIFPNWNVYK